MGSSQTRTRTRVSCIGRWILNHCATREVPSYSFHFSSTVLKKYHCRTIISLNAASSFPSWAILWDPEHFPPVLELGLSLPLLPSWQTEKYSRLIQVSALLLEGWEVGTPDLIFRRKKQYGWWGLRQIWAVVPIWVPGGGFFCTWHINTSPENNSSLWRKSSRRALSLPDFFHWLHRALHCFVLSGWVSALFFFLSLVSSGSTWLSSWSLPAA